MSQQAEVSFEKIIACFCANQPIFTVCGGGRFVFIALMNGDANSWNLLFTSRAPRLLAVLLAGAGLSIAGLIMQQISQNRFAAPSTSGTIECAMLGYVLSLVIFGDGNNLWLILR